MTSWNRRLDVSRANKRRGNIERERQRGHKLLVANPASIETLSTMEFKTYQSRERERESAFLMIGSIAKGFDGRVKARRKIAIVKRIQNI